MIAVEKFTTKMGENGTKNEKIGKHVVEKKCLRLFTPPPPHAACYKELGKLCLDNSAKFTYKFKEVARRP